MDQLVKTRFLSLSASPQNPSTVASTDREVLLALYRSTDGVYWYRRTNWGTRAALSDWYGVDVNEDGRVVRLKLGYNNLRGTVT